MPGQSAERTIDHSAALATQRSLWSIAVRSAVVAAVAGVASAVVVAVLCWLPDAGVSGRAGSALRAGLLSFLAAQHGGITVDGISAQFLPLGMLLIVATFIWRAGRTIADAIDESTSPPQLGAALGLGALTYAAACAVVVEVSRLGTSHASLLAVPTAAFVLFAVVAGVAIASTLSLTLPSWLVGAARGAVAAAALYLASGALLVAGSLIVHAHRVTDLSGQVGGGLSSLPILVISLLCAPNAAVAGAAYLAGPGFAVGSDTTVNAFSTSHGVLPALPVLGAIPDGHGADVLVLALMGVVPLLAAAVVARAIRRAGPSGFWRQLRSAMVSAALTGSALAVAAWLGGGSAGTGRLRVVGASVWQVGFAVTAVVGVLAVLAISVLSAWDWLVPPRPESTGSSDPGSSAAPKRDLVGANAGPPATH